MVDEASKPGRGAPLRRGDVVGRYVIIDVSTGEDASGHGSYAAFDPELDRRVVLKVMPTASHDPDHVLRQRRLQREAQAMARVNHPNVLAVHDVGDHDGQLFVAMEHVEGTTLRAWLDTESRPWREVLGAFVSAGRGLEAAHDCKLVHRDFTPDNVIVTDDGRICVWGFGSVRATASRSSSGSQERRMSADMVFRTQLTRREDVIGSPAYTAPEQQQGDKVTAAADQYSFCVALYEALFGKHPFAGDTTADRRLAAMQGRVEPSDRAEVPIPIRRAIDRGLAPEPHLRHGSMADLIHVLTEGTQRRRRILAGLGVVALGLAAAVGWTLHRHNAEMACVQAAARIDELWNPRARVALEESLVKTGSPYADVALGHAEADYEAFAEAWRGARYDVCRAALDDTLDPQLVRAAVACLDLQAAVLEEQIGMLPEITHDFVYATTTAVRRARRPSACLDYDLVARREIPEPEAMAAALEARRLFVRGTILERMVRWDEAAEHYQQALDHAERAGATETIASAHLGLGMIADARGDVATSRKELETAFELAAAGGADLEAGEAAAKLTMLVGYKAGHPRSGLAWAELAGAYFDQAGVAEDAQRRASLLEQIGIVQLQLDPDLAIGNLTRAHEMSVGALGAGHPESARVLNNLANALLEVGRYAEAQAAYEQVLARQHLVFGARHPFVADTTFNLGMVALRRGQFEQSELHLDAALDLRLEILPADHPAIAISYLGIAQLEARRRNLDALIKAADRADAIFAVHPPTMRRIVGLMVAAQGLMDDRPKLARKYIERAEKLANQVEPARIATELRAVVALVLASDGETERAQATAHRALDDAVANGAPPKELTMCYAMLANVYFAARKLPEARRYADLAAPHDPAAAGVQAGVLVMQGEAEAAIELAEPALRDSERQAKSILATQSLRIMLAHAYVSHRSLERAVALLGDIDDAAPYGLSDRFATSVDVLWAEIHQLRGEPASARARLDRIAGRTVGLDDPLTVDALARLRAELAG